MEQVPHIRDYVGRTVHMIGIGGSSMSGLAQMLLAKGYRVQGSDRDEGYLIQDVRDAGARIMIGHRAENVHGADLVIYSAAIHPDNPERAEAARLGIPSLERAYLLGQLMESSRMGIGVCGAHGKTTTTSILALILMRCGKDPSIHIGGKLDAIGGSTRVGRSGIFLAEACEYNRSFLHMPPQMAVVLNIDADHLDCYRDIDEIEETFGRYLHLLPADGIAIGNGDDPRIVRQLGKLSCRTVTFGFGEACDYRAYPCEEDERGCCRFDLTGRDGFNVSVRMQVPGRFNADNALAALTAALELGCDPAEAARAVEEFTGAHRRFEKTGELNGAELFHDYGHNPAEMRNAVSIARKRCGKTLYAVMQPHTYSRVKALFNDYLNCTEEADVTLVTDICAAREKDPGDIRSSMLVDGMRAHGVNAFLTPTFDDTEDWLRRHLQPGDLAITMGCGDINMLNEQIRRHEASSAGADENRTNS
ncbi:MAG: UDP-N-acetylmuramate--L-alanine ligase [Clostridia bacterium]|nr:UDP-N-acetylmuramate--L-alanine ligase [Clostridia bacterium]